MATREKELKVFIAGSRSLSRLSKEVTRRIDNVLAKGLAVVVGDANGMDKAVQKYLKKQHYERVIVYCMENVCRNNEGNWETREVQAAETKRRDFAFFSSKDRAMAEAADYGLMLWDGESRGTLTNIIDLVRRGKPVVVYLAPEKIFVTLKEPEDLTNLRGKLDSAAILRVHQELQVQQTQLAGRASVQRRETSLLF
jgi:hypothetical protein